MHVCIWCRRVQPTVQCEFECMLGWCMSWVQFQRRGQCVYNAWVCVRDRLQRQAFLVTALVRNQLPRNMVVVPWIKLLNALAKDLPAPTITHRCLILISLVCVPRRLDACKHHLFNRLMDSEYRTLQWAIPLLRIRETSAEASILHYPINVSASNRIVHRPKQPPAYAYPSLQQPTSQSSRTWAGGNIRLNPMCRHPSCSPIAQRCASTCLWIPSLKVQDVSPSTDDAFILVPDSALLAMSEMWEILVEEQILHFPLSIEDVAWKLPTVKQFSCLARRLHNRQQLQI